MGRTSNRELGAQRNTRLGTDSGPRLGVAIAAHQSAEVVGDCLRALDGLEAVVVLYDDGSTDGTAELARGVRADVVVLQGDGTAWWTGGTNAAAAACFERGCEYVLLLNPDVRITEKDVRELVEYAEAHPLTIVAALVVDDADSERVAWAGSRFGRLDPHFPIYASRYIAKRGDSVATLSTEPYSTDEAHGRGVLLSRAVVERIGLFDECTFPHYGADVDYSLRARAADIRIVVHPGARAQVVVERTGMGSTAGLRLRERLLVTWNYLTERKHGEALRVNWYLACRHLPPHAALASYAFVLALNVFRRLAPR